MKCPLLVMGQLSNEIPVVASNSDCLKEKCAWWSPLDDCCAIRDLPGLLMAMGNAFGKIADRMPKDLAPKG